MQELPSQKEGSIPYQFLYILVNFVTIYIKAVFLLQTGLSKPAHRKKKISVRYSIIFHVIFKACIFKPDMHFSYTQISTYLAVQSSQVPTEENYIAQSSCNIHINPINSMLSMCVTHVPMFSRQAQCVHVLENSLTKSSVWSIAQFYTKDCRDIPIPMDTGTIVTLMANKVQENLISFSHFLCISPSYFYLLSEGARYWH